MTQEDRKDIAEEYAYQMKRYNYHLKVLEELESKGEDTTPIEKTLEFISGWMRGMEDVLCIMGYTVREHKTGEWFVENN